MKPLLSCAECTALDSATQEQYGLSVEQLMERAASAVYSALLANYGHRLPRRECADTPGTQAEGKGYPAAFVVLAGSGSNGGDALAVARMARYDGVWPVVALVSARPGPVAAAREQEARQAGVRVFSHGDTSAPELLKHAGLILDGLCGTGFSPAPDRQLPLQAALESVRSTWAGLPEESRPMVLALDIPSGMSGLTPVAGSVPDTAANSSGTNQRLSPETPAWYRPIPADATLALEPLKTELYYPGNRPICGRILEVPGVFPREAILAKAGGYLLGDCDVGRLLRRPSPDAHKGSRGALAVYAGNRGTTGAALLCSRAAQAAGAGTVTLHVRDDLYDLFAVAGASVMVRPLSAGSGRQYSASLIGPGLGLDNTARELVREAWFSTLPLVLDADALRLCASLPRRSGGAPTILLPHPGELLSLAEAFLPAEAPDSVRLEAAYSTRQLLERLAVASGAIIVLKNAVTWLAHPDGRFLVFEGREPALGAGGSGDVLAGFAAALLASGADAWTAAASAVLVHGLCGRQMAAERGYGDPAELCGYAARMFYTGRLQ